jgi:hypothetical protein
MRPDILVSALALASSVFAAPVDVVKVCPLPSFPCPF